MKKPVLLKLGFKGDRDYLHGSDIIPELLKFTGPITDLSVNFNKITSKTLIAQQVTESDVSKLRTSDELCVLLTYLKNNKREFVAVSETNSPVSCHCQYNESEIIRGNEIHEKIIFQQECTAGNFFERIIALNKKLLNTTICNGKWLFVRLDLKSAPVEPKSISLQLTRDINGSWCQSAIKGDGIFIGKIVFLRKL